MDGVSRGWCILLVAGLTEVVWATAMGLSDGFREWEWTLVTAVFLTISTWLLSKALDHGLPVGGAYATWVGIGALGTVAASSLIGMEHLSAESVLFVLMVAAGVIGLQATGRSHARRGVTPDEGGAVRTSPWPRHSPFVGAASHFQGHVPDVPVLGCLGQMRRESIKRPVGSRSSRDDFCGSGPIIVILLPFVIVRNRS